jgi:hypothetical protein
MADEEPKALVPRYAGLRPIQKGEVRNPLGRNGKFKIDELRKYLSEKAEPSSPHTRRENLLLALYTTSIDRRRRDHVAAARVLLAYDLGLPAQALQVDHSNTDGSMTPAVIRVYAVKPRDEGTDETTPIESSPGHEGSNGG